MGKEEKTNAIRFLERAGIAFELRSYEWSEDDLSARSAADKLGLDPDTVFKTIVLVGQRTGPFVCVVPGTCEVDLKKAARAAGDKDCAPLPLKELEGLTGYLRGGCSPLGMKRRLPIFVDETVLAFDRVSVSAGRRGLQIRIAPGDLVAVAGAVLADLT